VISDLKETKGFKTSHKGVQKVAALKNIILAYARQEEERILF
jgi:hypothetical protein